MLLLFSSFSASPVRGDDGGMPGPEGGMGPGMPGEKMEPADAPRFLSKLNLTPEQIELLRKERHAKMKQMIQVRAEMETLHVDLREAGEQDKLELEKVEALAQKIGALHAKIIVERVKSLAYLRSILTPEQKKLLAACLLEGPGNEGFKDGKTRGGWKQRERR